MIQKSFVVALMLIGLTSFAKEKDPFLKLGIKGGKEFFLFIDKVSATSDDALISLKDLKGEVLYTENLTRGDQYRKLFDLNALPEGEYILQIEDGTRIKTWPLEITRAGLKLQKAGNTDFYKPQIISREVNKVGISLLNAEKQYVQMSIFDNNSNLLFNESLSNELIIQKMYDLSQLPAGSYNVSVRIAGKKFNEIVEVK